jgi:hypothetical protein
LLINNKNFNQTKSLQYLRVKPKNTTTLRYALKFVSIITPGTIKNLRLILASQYEKKDTHNKILVKQSYLLLTWLVYVKGSYSTTETQKIPSFFVQPVSRYKLTNLKTPMAHKTFSQEQFLFKHYTLTISFKHALDSKSNLTSVNSSIYTALLMRSETPFFNTNLLFLKRFSFSFPSSDKSFMLL